jgi:hypothetical protein
MEDRSITDSQVTASSFKAERNKSFKPVNEFSTAHAATKIFFVLDPFPRKYVECY